MSVSSSNNARAEETYQTKAVHVRTQALKDGEGGSHSRQLLAKQGSEGVLRAYLRRDAHISRRVSSGTAIGESDNHVSPRGTDGVRVVFESSRDRTSSLQNSVAEGRGGGQVSLRGFSSDPCRRV